MSLVDAKHLPAYQLEKQLDNHQRGVSIRYMQQWQADAS